MKFTNTQKAPQAIGPYSQAVVVNGMVFSSGQIALKPNGEFLEGGVQEQCEQVLKNLKEVLEASGSSMDRVIKTTVYLVNMDDFTLVNEVYAKHFGDHKPSRSAVAVKTLPKNALVEIEAIGIV
ncbi:MAG: RidA family protein [Campylobacterales bacterium]